MQHTLLVFKAMDEDQPVPLRLAYLEDLMLNWLALADRVETAFTIAKTTMADKEWLVWNLWPVLNTIYVRVTYGQEPRERPGVFESLALLNVDGKIIEPIRAARQMEISSDPQFRLGPDVDTMARKLLESLLNRTAG